METLTFLVHDPHDPISCGTVQVLEDWSAAGWIERFALVGIAEVIHHGGAVAQNRLRIPPGPGSPPALRSLDRLADGRSLRIAVLDPVGRDQEWLAARGRRHEAGRLLHEHISGRIGAVDLVIPWHNGYWDSGAMTRWPGWDTLIAAPETASSPVDTGLALYCDPDSPDDVLRVAAHAAAFVATVCGLWVGGQGVLWDRTDDVDDIRMARTFHIRLDGTGAGALLSAAMLDPTALHAPGAIPAKTTAEFAPRVARLRTKLQLEPAPPVSDPAAPEHVGAWEAVRMLVSFLWRALLMAPSELSSTLLSRTRSASADRLSSLIFGRSSSKQVTVSGMLGRQVSAAAAVRDVSGSEERLAGVLQRLRSHDPGMPTSAPASAQEAFWRATVNNILALVSGEHSLEVDPVVEEGVHRWFTPDQIAPASALTWRPLPSLSLPGLGDEVSVHDVRACDDALGELRAMGELEGRWRDDVERSRRDLERASTEWRASFLGQVGTMLSAGIGHYRDALTSRLDELEGLSEPHQAEAEDLAGEVVRHVRVTSLIFGAMGLVLIVLDATNIVSWSVWAWLPALVVGWLVALSMGYLRVQRRIFQLVHRAQQQQARSTSIEQEVPTLVENLRRLRQVYEQYLVWARLIPTFLQQPLGAAQPDSPQTTRLAGQVPSSVITGHYEVRDESQSRLAMSGMVREVRTRAGDAWSEFVRSSFEGLAKERPEFAALMKEDVYGLEDQRLEQWLEVVRAPDSPGLAMAAPLAERLSRTQTRAVLERTDPARLQEVIGQSFSAFTAEGRPIRGHAPSAEPAPFRTEAFSLEGLNKHLPQPDVSVPRRPGPGTTAPRQTDHVLDEVACVMVMTRRLAFGDVQLTRVADVPSPSGDPRPTPADRRVRF